MGLDTVEIVLQVEETFALELLPDFECEQVRTVGDLYRLILRKLDLEYRPAVEFENEPPPYRHTYVKVQWNAATVWYTLKQIILDQLQVDEDKVHESASFLNDLGCD